MVEDRAITLASPLLCRIVGAGSRKDDFNYTFDVWKTYVIGRREEIPTCTQSIRRAIPVSSTTYIRREESQPAAAGLDR